MLIQAQMLLSIECDGKMIMRSEWETNEPYLNVLLRQLPRVATTPTWPIIYK